MKKILSFTLALIFCVFVCGVAFAHPGGTDSAGGHYDTKTGEYHYHHGHPAHQHKNGVCPYGDYDDSDNTTEYYYDDDEEDEEDNDNYLDDVYDSLPEVDEDDTYDDLNDYEYDKEELKEQLDEIEKEEKEEKKEKRKEKLKEAAPIIGLAILILAYVLIGKFIL